MVNNLTYKPLCHHYLTTNFRKHIFIVNDEMYTVKRKPKHRLYTLRVYSILYDIHVKSSKRYKTANKAHYCLIEVKA